MEANGFQPEQHNGRTNLFPETGDTQTNFRNLCVSPFGTKFHFDINHGPSMHSAAENVHAKVTIER